VGSHGFGGKKPVYPDLRVAPRTLATAIELMVSILIACGKKLLILMDDHLPYPSAILKVFGQLRHHRRKHGHGRKCRPTLKPPPGLLVGVVKSYATPRGTCSR
jgi:hypothetical protein